MILNNLDYFILIVSLYIMYQSGKRGMMEEIVGGLSFLLAFTISYIFGSKVEEKVNDLLGIKALSMIISYGLIFIVLLSVFYYIINLIIPKKIVKTTLDRSLGVCFGFIKFIVIVVAITYVVDLVFPETSQLEIIHDSYINKLSQKILNMFLKHV